MEKYIPGRIDKHLNRGVPKDFDPKEIHPNSLLDATPSLPAITNTEIIEAYKVVLDRFSTAEKVIGDELAQVSIPISDFAPDAQTCITNLFGPSKLEIKFGDYKKLLEYCATVGKDVAGEELAKEGVI
jgi:hypothetical protein